ncbi:MAG: HAD-IA family hydrolase, partial [Planctomycetota bacterium]|nr:HAD-IA family hydrolase [Planctomycetota bacterium]
RVDGAFRYSDLWFRSYIAHVFAGLGLVGERSGLERTLLGLFSDAANFEVFPDVRELLERAAAMPVAVVSNWGERLEPLLEGLGLTVDLAMSSALEEVEKPDPEIFHRALARLGVEPGRVLHIGDRADTDVAGARAAGIRAVLLDRSGRMSPPPGVRVVNGLAEVEL